MRIKLSLPRAWPIVSQEPRMAEVLPGVTLTIGRLIPLPADLRAWGDQIVFGELPPEQVRMALAKDMGTVHDWPVSLFGSDVIHPRSKAVLERRLHAVFRFDHHGGVAILRSANTVFFDSIVKEVTAVLLAAEPDWGEEQVLALGDLWKGLSIEQPAKPAQTGPDAPAAPPSHENLWQF